MSRPRVGLIGGGRWAGVHRNALQTAGAELSGVLVATAASRGRLRREWGVPVTTDPEEFLAWPMDGAIVCSPNHLHDEHAVRALDAGLHVLVEKPLATTLAGCDRILAAAERSGRVVAVGLEMRTFRLFERVRALLDDGAIGRPLHLALDLWRRPYRAGAGGWKADPAKLGSSILEEPIHYLDLARWYLGEPEGLQAWATSRSGREGLWECLDVRLAFATGAQALVTRSIAAWGHAVSLKLVGEEGSLWAEWRGRMDVDPEPRVGLVLHRGGRDGATEAVAVPRETGHAFDVPRQTRAFLAAMAGEGRPAADGADGRAAVALSLAVERSLEEGSSPLRLLPGGEVADGGPA